MKKQKIKTRAEMVVMAIAVIAAVAFINYIGTKRFFRLDLTENKQYTVSGATRQALRSLDDIVTVKAFFSKELPPEVHITVNTVRDLLNEYKNIAGGRLRVEWIDPTGNEDAMNAARSLGIPEIRLQTVKRDKVEAMIGYMGIGIMYADRNEAIPIVQNLQNLEYDLTLAIMKVNRGEPPKIGLLKSQTADFLPAEIRDRMNMAEMTTQRRFAPVFDSFNRDYNLIVVDVSEGQEIPSDIKTLIIPSGERFPTRTIFEIDQYFMNGGNLIVLANAVEAEFSQFGVRGNPVTESKLLDLIEYYGVRVERNMIMDLSCGRVQIPRNLGFFTINEVHPYPYFVRIFENGFAQDNPVTAAQTDLMLGWASSLTRVPDTLGLHRITATTLFTSSEQSWEVTEQFDLNPRPQEEYGSLIPSQNLMKPYVMGIHLSGDFKSYFAGQAVPPVREAASEDEDDASNINRIVLPEDADREVLSIATGGNLVIIGDANFISAQNASRSNITFMQNLVDWLSLDNNLISIRSRVLRDKTIDPNVLMEGSSKPNMIRWLNLLFMPVIVAIAGIIISLRRRENIPAAAAAPAPASSAGGDKSAAVNKLVTNEKSDNREDNEDEK